LTLSQKKYNSETTIILFHFQSLPLFRDSATLKRLEIFKNKFSVYSRTIDKKLGEEEMKTEMALTSKINYG